MHIFEQMFRGAIGADLTDGQANLFVDILILVFFIDKLMLILICKT